MPSFLEGVMGVIENGLGCDWFGLMDKSVEIGLRWMDKLGRFDPLYRRWVQERHRYNLLKSLRTRNKKISVTPPPR